jgi:excisionase family DNA binding protein
MDQDSQYGTRQSDEGAARDLLTVEQAAQYLQLSASSIRSYIRQGKLKAFRVAGLRKVQIARPELLALLEPTHSDNTNGLPLEAGNCWARPNGYSAYRAAASPFRPFQHFRATHLVPLLCLPDFLI